MHTLETAVFEVIVPILNIAFLAGNVFYQSRFRKIQVDREILGTLTDQCKAKDEVINHLHKEKKQYQLQYNSLLHEYKKAEGELKAYRLVNKPKPALDKNLP